MATIDGPDAKNWAIAKPAFVEYLLRKIGLKFLNLTKKYPKVVLVSKDVLYI